MPYDSLVADLPKPLVEIPPLENGDRLTRAEFEHRYGARPELNKAELARSAGHDPRRYAKVLDVLEQGLATPEHAAFVERLKSSGIDRL